VGRSAKQSVESIQQDGFTGAGFTGEHRESAAEIELQLLNQRDVLKAQSSEQGGDAATAG
jgi:hypothetical protein